MPPSSVSPSSRARSRRSSAASSANARSRSQSRSQSKPSRSASKRQSRSAQKSSSTASLSSSPSAASSSSSSTFSSLPDSSVRSPFSSVSQYLCDSILGVNDGLVSIFLLLVGTAAASHCSSTCLLSGIAGALAGAFSMGIGEYLATKSQIEATQAELVYQREFLKDPQNRHYELEEISKNLQQLGLIEKDILSSVYQSLQRLNEEQLFQWRKMFEIGMSEAHQRNPFMAMAMAGGLFFLGSFPSIIPFVFIDSAMDGLYMSALLTGISLFLVGALKTKITKGNLWLAGLENLLLCGVSAVVAWFVGSTLEHLTGIKGAAL